MKMYFNLQFKRAWKLLPLVMVVALILFSGLTVIFNAFIESNNNNESNIRFKIALSGDTDGMYLKLGMAALQNFDSSRFAVEIVTMTEEDAIKAIEDGEISAYAVMPEGFLEAALRGEIRTIKYVTKSGAVGLVSIFKDEITKVVSDLVEESQRGVYGVADALDSTGNDNLSYYHLNELNIKYIDMVLDRNKLYDIEELGVSQGLSLPVYIFCGISVLFLFLTCLPYAALYVKKDISLNRVLSSRGNTALKQVLAEYISFFLAMIILFSVAFSVLALLTVSLDELSEIGIPCGLEMLLYGVRVVPIVALVTACSFMIFELSGNLINGMLLQFFVCISLCYISGCFYPIYAFPVAVQKTSNFLPTGMARRFLGAGIAGESVIFEALGMVLYILLFISVSALARGFKISGKRGKSE